MGNLCWTQSYPTARVLHIENEGSDHSMILMETNPREKRRKTRFHFDKRWLEHKDFEGVIRLAWDKQQEGSRSFRTIRKIRECRRAIWDWSKRKHQNAREEINSLKKEIKRIRNHLGSNNKDQLSELRKKLGDAYRREEQFWSQKARMKWLKEGDKNSAYFHATVVTRRKRNRITRLQKETGEWCTTDEEFEAEVEGFYRQLFTSQQSQNCVEILQGIPKTITEQMNLQLTLPVTEKEIHEALFTMQPDKAPGPDGSYMMTGLRHIQQPSSCSQFSGVRNVTKQPKKETSSNFCKHNLSISAINVVGNKHLLLLSSTSGGIMFLCTVNIPFLRKLGIHV